LIGSLVPGEHNDAAGLAAVLQGHHAELLRFLRARTGDVAEAQDVIQELWLRLQNSASGPVANPRAYLFQAANNLVLDRIRERRRRVARDSSWAEATHGVASPGAEVLDPQPDPAQALIEAEQGQRLADAIADLPDAARRAFCLHKIDGLSHTEVAARLGISRSGVEKHMAVAIRHLRRALQD
jgi:RNA polymerase sigma factor (sigma-70 family)